MRHICILLICISVGCSHKLEPMPADLQARLQEALQEKEPETVVISAPRTIVRHREMSEETATQIWLETGVYRGLTDEEWINLMDELRFVQQQRRERLE
jgi:hypothetical protein